MSKYQLTTEQFKKIIMPFIETAKKATADNKVNFKVTKADSFDPYGFTIVLDSTKRYGGYITLSIDEGSKLCFVRRDGTPLTDYLYNHIKEINKALRVYMYEQYGDDYKDYITDFYEKKQQENLEHIKQERKRLKKELEALDREEKDTKENFGAEIKDIENLSNPHQV